MRDQASPSSLVEEKNSLPSHLTGHSREGWLDWLAIFLSQLSIMSNSGDGERGRDWRYVTGVSVSGWLGVVGRLFWWWWRWGKWGRWWRCHSHRVILSTELYNTTVSQSGRTKAGPGRLWRHCRARSSSSSHSYSVTVLQCYSVIVS